MLNDGIANNDSWIALECIGNMTFCLHGALIDVFDESLIQQESSQTKIPDSPNSSLIESILDSFGHAVLDAQTNAKETLGDFQASLIGSTACYTRIGNYWRVLGSKKVVLKQGHPRRGVPELMPLNSKGVPQLEGASETMMLTSPSFHILAYCDR